MSSERAWREALGANLRTNLRFYRRNRLLVIGSLVVLGMLALFSIPAALFSTAGQRFMVIGQLLQSYSFFSVLLVGVLGLVALSSHTRNRSYELIVTRACPPEGWLLSQYLSAAVVGGVLCLLAILLGLVAFLVLGIPPQGGVVYLAIQAFCQAMILFAYLTFLASLLHPAVALILAFIVRPSLISGLLLWVSAGAGAVGHGPFAWLLTVLKPVLRWAYYVLPILNPDSGVTARIGGTLRIEAGDLTHLGATLGYTLVLSALLFLLTALVLRRRPIRQR